MQAATGSPALPAGFQNQPVPRYRGTATYREAPPTAAESRWHEEKASARKPIPQRVAGSTRQSGKRAEW